MTEFVAEIKGRSFPLQNYTSLQQKKDFVAEIRPRSCNETGRTDISGCCSSDNSDLYVQRMLSDMQFSRERITNMLENSVLTLVEKLLTGRSISRIHGTLCVSLSTNESPIVVDLHKIFPKSYSSSCMTDQSIENSLNVKFKEPGVVTLCSPCEKPSASCSPYYDFSRESCQSPAGSDSSLQVSSGYHTDRDSTFSRSPCFSQTLSPIHDSLTLSPPNDNHTPSSPQNTHIHSPVHNSLTPSSPQNNNIQSLVHNSLTPSSPHDDSRTPSPLRNTDSMFSSARAENELIRLKQQNSQQDNQTHEGNHSCYILNDKSNSNIPNDASKDTTTRSNMFATLSKNTFNDYYCSGFDGKDTLYIPPVSPASDISQNKLDTDFSTSSGESDEIDYFDEDDDEDRLVIDENPVKENLSTMLDETCDNTTEKTRDNCTLVRYMPINTIVTKKSSENALVDGKRILENVRDEIQDEDSLMNSEEITDSCDRVNLPGNSKYTTDHKSAIPHPQSIVTIHSEGFSCKQCLTILPDTLSVCLHVQEKHDLHCCTHCFRTFTAKNNLNRHMRRHTGQRPYECSQCSRSFFRRDDLKGHMLRHSYNKPFRCSLCKKGYTDRACVKNHMAKEHRSRLTHVCPQCGESFNKEDAFTEHKRSHPELQQFSCTTCSFIGTNKLMALKHNLLHSHKLFSCKPCNAHFSDPFHYTNHIKKHKRNTSFTKYICCFCDTVLSNYDQYVRHEYSHAQGKTHTCTICKTQYRSKSLLQKHAITHKEKVYNEFEIDKCCLNVVNPQSLPQSINTVKENHVFTRNVYLSPSPSIVSRRQSYDSETNITVPEMQDDDEYCGQLLDLSMKKSSSQSSSSDNSITSLRNTGNQVQNFPRNGVVNTEPVNLKQKCEVNNGDLTSEHLVKAEIQTDSIQKSARTVRDNQVVCNQGLLKNCLSYETADVPVDASNSRERNKSSLQVRSSRSKSFDRTNIISNASDLLSERRAWQRVTPYSRPPLRLSSQYRQKIADLATKFMVARGTKPIGQRTPLKTISPGSVERMLITEPGTDEKNLPTLTASPDMKQICQEENERRNLVQRVCKDNVEVICEDSFSGTTLRCHIPTVVKSEPLLYQTKLSDSPLDCRFPKTIDDNARTDVETMTRFGHSCEICREHFGSFLELETHSVELHKRYLCEHCRKSFTARPNRDRHVRYHTGERPYKCDLCDMAFFRGDDLKYHRTTRHPSAQPFICTRCSASFTWGRDLERHIRHSKCSA
uniref:C2H2-type domain-containing protein n=1 Tax=Arion vulgaris TaxID=1028688 RepID=A0A0B7BG16_9EUPU